MNLNYSKKTFCIFVLLMVFISLSTVSAMEINSTDDMDSTYNQLGLENDDEKLSIINDENYLSSAETFNGTTFSELESKINSLKNGDVLDLTSNVTQDGDSQITISKSITINGNGVTIDAQGKSRIFYINSGATVVLNNITFTNGYQDVKGGAINNENGNVTITASQFIKNNVNNLGGAIYNQGTMNIAETYFIANKATGGDGGAICNYEGELTIAGSHFINNTASFNGGAIRIGGKSTVTNCNFTNNTVNKYYGGAIYADEESTVTDCNFVDNHADNYSGGAIFFYYKGNVTNSCTET